MLLERLIEEKIPFQVCVGKVFARGVKNAYGSDYFMIAPTKYGKKLMEIRKDIYSCTFGRSPRKDVIIHNMTKRDIREFKAMQSSFKKALHCKWGRVYELK